LRRGIRFFSFQKSPAGGELNDSHVTPKSSLNILGYGRDLRKFVPISSDWGKLAPHSIPRILFDTECGSASHTHTSRLLWPPPTYPSG
jgi:hypothetical protein